MDTSSSELQELRRLVGELTARVFRLERALNLPAAVSAEAPGSRHAETPPPICTAGAAVYRRRCRTVSAAAARSIRESRRERTWNPASVRTG